jgi:hypothetical protein
MEVSCLNTDAVCLRVHGQGNLGGKPRNETMEDILAAIRKRRA